ncbi:hypothetical protein PENTCL1PPCAC_10513, partial [Pristionchus entomophagus]
LLMTITTIILLLSAVVSIIFVDTSSPLFLASWIVAYMLAMPYLVMCFKQSVKEITCVSWIIVLPPLFTSNLGFLIAPEIRYWLLVFPLIFVIYKAMDGMVTLPESTRICPVKYS